MKYIPALDGVRGIAILLVLLLHFELLDVGWIGVDLFFVLSGFLITNILLKGRGHSAGYFFKRFYWRRTLRIFPLYFAVLLVMSAAWFLTRRPEGLGEMLPYLYTYTYNIWLGITTETGSSLVKYLWSLSFEEQFYLVWPFLVFFVSRKGLTWIVAGLIVLSPVIRWLLGEYLSAATGSSDHVGGYLYCLPFGRMDTFAMGALLALAPVRKLVKHPLRLFYCCVGLFILAGLANLTAVIGEMPSLGYSSLGYPVASLRNLQHVWAGTLINLVSASLVLVAIHPPEYKGGYVRRVLEIPWLRWGGRISYGIYLLHWPLQYLMEKVIPLPESYLLRAAIFFPFLALVLLISWLSFHCFESYFLRLKSKKFNSPLRKPDQSKA